MIICSVTAKDKAEDTTIYKSLQRLDIDVDLDIVTGNTESLPKIYNKLIELHKEEDYVVFVHDDVYIKSDIRPIIEMYLQHSDLLGVAGSSKVSLKKPALWHLMGDKDTLHGLVEHGTEDLHGSSYFGQVPARVVTLDGVLMVLSNKLMNSNVRYDENIPSRFHFYDLDFSIESYNNGFKNLVIQLPIIHESGGLSSLDDKEWLEGQEYFLNKHKK